LSGYEWTATARESTMSSSGWYVNEPAARSAAVAPPFFCFLPPLPLL
jgi:hypothetical protein